MVIYALTWVHLAAMHTVTHPVALGDHRLDAQYHSSIYNHHKNKHSLLKYREISLKHGSYQAKTGLRCCHTSPTQTSQAFFWYDTDYMQTTEYDSVVWFIPKTCQNCLSWCQSSRLFV